MSPSSASADRNLLFGILALQMDFINRDALIAAMHAWVLDKAKSIGQVLVEQGALSYERWSMLETLVQEHLKQHSNDAQQSLAAVAAAPALRKQLDQVSD